MLDAQPFFHAGQSVNLEYHFLVEQPGNEKDLSEMNARVVEAYNAKMRANKKRIEEMRQENTEIRIRIKSVSMVTDQQAAAGNKKR